jgi:hypothetical protein
MNIDYKQLNKEMHKVVSQQSGIVGLFIVAANLHNFGNSGIYAVSAHTRESNE